MTRLAEPPLLQAHRESIADGLYAAIASKDAALSRTIAAYHLGLVDREGVRRTNESMVFAHASLCLWAAHACGGTTSQALAVALGVELLSRFVHVHQDISSGATFRDGRETVWAIWGVEQGVNGGDVLHSLALSALTCGNADPTVALRVFERVGGASVEMLNALVRDRDDLRTTLGRDGALFGASLEAGAIVAGASDRTAALLRRAGRAIGVDDAERARALVEQANIEAVHIPALFEAARYLAKADS